MKIAGLTISQFIGAIIVGLILSFVIITLITPHDEKSIVQQPLTVQVVTMGDMALQIQKSVANLVLLTVGLVVISVVFSVIGGFGRP